MAEKRVGKPSAVLILGAISIATWLLRRGNRGRRRRNPEPVSRPVDGIAHELNDYLGAIRGYCEVAKMRNPSDPALARGMDAAMESATKAAALVRQLGAGNAARNQ